MKLILSRKGFDASAGGCASVITTNNELISLPIPEKPEVDHSTTYDEIRSSVGSLGPIVSKLTGGKTSGIVAAHLDPDLVKQSLSRDPGNWAPAFGQRAGSATHLDNEGVDVGDLFLFFGWFCRYDLATGRPITGARDLHLIFGWLQVGEIFRSNAIPRMLQRYPGLSKHPHVHQPRTMDPLNRIYVASSTLCLPGLNRAVPGGGVFSFRFSNVLTRPGVNRADWVLKGWGTSSTAIPPLSYHPDAKWGGIVGYDWELTAAYPGQEFVVDTDRHPDALAWAVDLFCDVRRWP